MFVDEIHFLGKVLFQKELDGSVEEIAVDDDHVRLILGQDRSTSNVLLDKGHLSELRARTSTSTDEEVSAP